MKVLLINHGRNLGGAEKHPMVLAQQLKLRGHQALFAGPRDGWAMSQLQGSEIPTFEIPMRGLLDVISIARLARLLKAEKVDLVNGHTQRGSHYAAWAGRFAGVASVATAHSPDGWRYHDKADHIIAVAEAVKTNLLKHGYGAKKITVVPNGVPDQRPAVDAPALDFRRELGFPADAVIAGMVARVVERKGQDLALKALALQPASSKVHLVIAGPDDTSFAQTLRAMTSDLGLTQRVKFLGSRADVGEVIKGLDFVLAPSRHEAMSLTLIETACVGRAVIATMVGGNAEVVIHGETGLLVPTEDVAALASAIAALAGDARVRQGMGEAARIRYEQQFHIDTMVDRTIEVYEQVLLRRQASVVAAPLL